MTLEACPACHNARQCFCVGAPGGGEMVVCGLTTVLTMHCCPPVAVAPLIRIFFGGGINFSDSETLHLPFISLPFDFFHRNVREPIPCKGDEECVTITERAVKFWLFPPPVPSARILGGNPLRRSLWKCTFFFFQFLTKAFVPANRSPGRCQEKQVLSLFSQAVSTVTGVIQRRECGEGSGNRTHSLSLGNAWDTTAERRDLSSATATLLHFLSG